MKRKVQDLAPAINYTPNPLAMGLLRQETRMIGVIVPDLITQCNLSPKDASDAARKLLRLKNRPDAIFGINDKVIFAAMREITKGGPFEPANSE